MSDRDGYDPGYPWHILTTRQGLPVVVDTFVTPTEVIAALMQLHNPHAVIVRHIPTNRDGDGLSFLDMANRTFTPTPSSITWETRSRNQRTRYGRD